MIRFTGTRLLKTAADMPEVACVAIFHNGKILMGRRRDVGKWTQPGGHLEGKETPLEGAVRETREEAGIDLEPHTLKHLRTEVVTKPDGKKIRVHAYRAFVHKAPTSIKEDPDAEVHRWHWLSLETLFSPTVWGELHVPPEDNVVMKGLGFINTEKTANKRLELFMEMTRKFGKARPGELGLSYHDFVKKASFLTFNEIKLKAPKHPDSWYPKDQIAKGMVVEKEHSENPDVRCNITKNHVDEDKTYYNNALFKKDLERGASMKTAFWAGFKKCAGEETLRGYAAMRDTKDPMDPYQHFENAKWDEADRGTLRSALLEHKGPIIDSLQKRVAAEYGDMSKENHRGKLKASLVGGALGGGLGGFLGLLPGALAGALSGNMGKGIAYGAGGGALLGAGLGVPAALQHRPKHNEAIDLAKSKSALSPEEISKYFRAQAEKIYEEEMKALD